MPAAMRCAAGPGEGWGWGWGSPPWGQQDFWGVYLHAKGGGSPSSSSGSGGVSWGRDCSVAGGAVTGTTGVLSRVP